MMKKRLMLFETTLSCFRAKESFREGWRSALRGETIPISELWEGIEGSEEEECDLD